MYKYELFIIPVELSLMPAKILNTEYTTVGTDCDLLHAISFGDFKTVKMHLANPWYNINQKDNDNNTALIIACYYGHLQIVRVLLKCPGIDINARNDSGENALNSASYNNYPGITKILLKAGVCNRPKKGTPSPLMYACFFGHCDIVDILLKEKSTLVNYVSKNGNSAVSFAIKGLCHGNNLETVMKILGKLLKAGANPFL